MQQVHFPVMPNVEGSRYVYTVMAILEKVKNEGADEKDVKRWMRAEGSFDKESYDMLKNFLGIVTQGEAVTLGPFAQKLMATTDFGKRQDLLFDKLAATNEILTKYVFEALQERLYSTNELYRMLTSYVYPGKGIELREFRNWLFWIEGTARIRVLGIRWAPGARFDDSLNYITSIDVDEILEEEAEEALSGKAKADAFAPPAPPAPAPVAAAPAPAPTPAPAPDPDGWEPPEDDDLPEDEPAAPAPPRPAPLTAAAAPADPNALAALAQALGGGALIEARLLQPAPQLSALAAGVPLERVREALLATPAVKPDAWLDELSASEETQAENLRALLEWWAGVEDRPLRRADHHGLMPSGWEDGARARFLFRLACLAVSLLRGEHGDVAFATLDGADFFTRLFDQPNSAERLLDELFEQGLGARHELFERLHLYLMLARSLRGAEDWCARLPALPADEALAALWQRLAAFQLHEETLWIARELSLFGILRQDELRALRVVPCADTRRAAFHLGLTESARATTLPALLALSRRLTPLLTHDLEAPLLAFWRAYGAHPPRRFWRR
jgi:hypothetical protein